MVTLIVCLDRSNTQLLRPTTGFPRFHHRWWERQMFLDREVKKRDSQIKPCVPGTFLCNFWWRWCFFGEKRKETGEERKEQVRQTKQNNTILSVLFIDVLIFSLLCSVNSVNVRKKYNAGNGPHFPSLSSPFWIPFSCANLRSKNQINNYPGKISQSYFTKTKKPKTQQRHTS